MTLRTSIGDGSALRWTKSSYSSNDGPECIEVAAATDAVHVRDSKDVARPGFIVSPAGWTAFTVYAARQGIRS
ncbi:DUF397 domain-containing protein [Streptomyces sp. RKND-216]|uniref:DUF397 domain-containing protein n=1 Tax=Streptomyces sp. RKND-216 TaxID=2562581 RepID=UPI00109DE5C5|nr:DUF397 domain-containing protein [Streptomyces sp. RKND-216]THA26541.1 DUF397 domain-containing protein [Streptomyces sp. RKND-216]